MARGMANKAMPSTWIVRSAIALMTQKTPRDDSRRSALGKQALGARSRSATRAAPSEGDDGGGGEGPIGQSRGKVAINRASGGAGTSARA